MNQPKLMHNNLKKQLYNTAKIYLIYLFCIIHFTLVVTFLYHDQRGSTKKVNKYII